MDVRTITSLIVAISGAVLGIFLSFTATKLLKRRDEKKILRFKDRQPKELNLSDAMPEDEKERIIRETIEKSPVLSPFRILLRYVSETATSLFFFLGFVIIAKLMRGLGDKIHMPEFARVFQILELVVLVLGGFLLVFSVIRITTEFTKMIVKGLLQKTLRK